MTSRFNLTTLDLPTLHRHAIGFDRLFDEIGRTFVNSRSDGNYPPYNIVRLDDTNYTVELAVAGFGQEEVEVEIKENLLTVKGEKAAAEEADKREYLHRGISSRTFVRTFTLADNVEVREATVSNGILTIALEHVVPEEKKAKKIQIEYKG